MKNFTRILRAAVWMILGGMLILSLAAAHRFTTTRGGSNSPGYAAQVTVTPETQDVSEIGSTDGIVFLGLLIGIIIVTPILLQRKLWSKK